MDLQAYLTRCRERAGRFRASPLVVGTASFALGIAAQNIINLPVAALFSGAALAWLAFAWRLRTCRLSVGLVLMFAFLAGGLHLAQARMVPSDHVSRIAGGPRTIEGRVVSRARSSGRQVSYVLDEVRLVLGDERFPLKGRVQVRSVPRFVPEEGSFILAEGTVFRPGGRESRWLKSEGTGVVIKVARSGRVVLLIGPGKEAGPPGLGRFKRRLKNIFDEFLVDPTAAGLAKALILGEKEGVPRPVREAMVRTGTWHVMVVSGSHTAFLAGCLLVLFKILPVPRPVRFTVIIGVLVLYCVLTGASSPVLRATVMAAAFLVGHLLRRLSPFSHSLALAGLVILIVQPEELFRLGFQLSFLSVAFIVGLYPKMRPQMWLKRWVRVGGWKGSLAYGTASLAALSLAAWLGTAPLLAHVFGTVTPFSVPANMAVVPLAMLATAAGFTLLLAGLVLPVLAPVCGAALYGLFWIFLKVNFLFAGLPWAALPVGPIPGPVTLGIYLLIVVGALLLPDQQVA